MTKYYLLTVIGFLSFTLLISSCTKDDTVDPPAEFIATNSTFDGISTWTLGGEFFGIDPSLGAAHGGNDSTVTRSVYFKADVKPSGGFYPLGAVITKRTHNTGGTLNQYTAMVKRGGDYNPDGNNWEFFMLAGEGQIAMDADGNEMRGVDLLDGMCIGCHTGAKSSDYIFTAR